MVIRTKLFSLILLSIGLSTLSAKAAVSDQLVPNNTPKFGAAARNMGRTSPSSVADVTIWLKPQNRDELDTLAKELYDPTSPNYRHWLDKTDFAARFAPTPKQAQAVKDFFTTNGLRVVTVGPDNFFIRAQGTVGNISHAFHVEINDFELNGKMYRGNTADPVFDGAISSMVSAVYGLDNLEYKHPVATQADAVNKLMNKGAQVTGFSPLATSRGAAPFTPFTSNCFTGKETEVFTTGGGLPKATYTGNGYTKNVQGCGYTPAEIRSAYNLNGLYKEGFDGTGQTIVIIDWCGSPTILHDANAFSTTYGLPPLTSKNFKVIPFPTRSSCSAPDAEINLDVEWAHAIAPGANIDLVVPPTPSFADVDIATFYAITYQLGNVISGSFGSPESLTPPAILLTEDFISETAAVMGISANYSTGDSGDFTDDQPDFNPATVNAPADSPYSTAVGGVSLALNPRGGIAWQTGWGTNLNLLVAQGFVFDPPVPSSLNDPFFGGSGGGPSGFFDKPPYQKNLKGRARQLPDISWLGDPFTGAIIAISEPNVFPSLQYTVIGGTSLACPMFSALWAIANQEAGISLGQAAPYLYAMPAGAITDVLPHGSSTNVTGRIMDSGGTTNYSAAALADPLEGTTTFFSVLYDYPLFQDTAAVLTFGTDTGLKTTKGWDNVTGLGTPNGKAFADYFRQ